MVCINVLIGALETMRLETRGLQHYRQALSDALDNPSVSRIVVATGQLLKAVDAFESSIAALLELVSEMDGHLGQRAMRSLAELTLHCRTVGILSQVEQLVGTLHEPHAHVPEMFTGELESVADVSERFYSAIAPMSCSGRAVPGSTGPPSDGAVEAIRSDRAAVQAGQRAIVQLGGDAAIVQFLRVGMARSDHPRIAGPCANIAALLDISFPVEPDPAIFGAAADPRFASEQSPSGSAGMPRAGSRR